MGSSNARARRAWLVTTLAVLATTASSRSAFAEDPEPAPAPSTDLEPLPPPSPPPPSPPPEPPPAPPAQAVEVQLSAAARWDLQRKRNLRDGLVTAVGSYALAGGTGAYMLLMSGSEERKELWRDGWIWPLFVPVGGPVYLAGRIAVEYTRWAVQPRHTTASTTLVVVLTPFVYASCVFVALEGLMQGVGVAQALGIAEPPRPKEASTGSPVRRSVWLSPAASPQHLGVDLGGRF